MNVAPWNVELARIAKQVAFDVVGFAFLYFLFLAATWRAHVVWLRVSGTVVFLLLVAFCLRVTPVLLSSRLVAKATALTKASESAGCVHKASTVVVLGGGIHSPEVLTTSTQMRVVEAAKIVKLATQEERILTVVLSGGFDNTLGVSEAQVMKRALFLEIGETGRTHTFLLEDKSRNTYQNAAYTKALLAKKSSEQIVLVTSAVHLPRSLATFERQGFDVCPVAAPSPELRTQGLASFHAGAQTVAVLNEYIGMLGYKLKGWN
ncbi:MAG: YdcF family protein [Silvanigrellales bacterium]|jgi:uncharacterized SAM-binding protein YcdF (DUF218 family)|nr:YdcF family protein [Silvanigrellales bacterium]